MSRTRQFPERHGITLLEVLIAMGILTVGLSSVAFLIPAGRSQAVKAAIYDRSATLAANAKADLITRGFLRTEKLLPNVSFSPNRMLIYDPLFDGTWAPSGATAVELREDAATFAVEPKVLNIKTPPDPTKWISPVTADILFRSEDDPLFAVPDDDPDAAPLPGWSMDPAGNEGRRAFEGTYSYLATLETGEFNMPFWLSGRQALLTIVAFHRRDPSIAPFTLEPSGSHLWVDPYVIDPTAAGSPIALPDGDTIRDVVKPGSMVLWTNSPPPPAQPVFSWFRALLITDESNGGPVQTSISFEGSDPPRDPTTGNLIGRLFVFPGAVAGVQTPVTLEGSSAWTE